MGTESDLFWHKEREVGLAWTWTWTGRGEGVLGAGWGSGAGRDASRGWGVVARPPLRTSRGVVRSVGETATRLRPLCLAWYRAESAAARRSISSRVSPRAIEVTPMEMVTLTTGPPGRSSTGTSRASTWERGRSG